jgi:S-adenosylmethionine decarboxylase
MRITKMNRTKIPRKLNSCSDILKNNSNPNYKNKSIDESTSKKNYGYHILARFCGCDKKLLDDMEELSKIFYGAVEYAKMNPTGDVKKKFEPQGVTIIIGLEESHIGIHTWPEDGVATLDVYTCGTEESCDRAYQYIKEKIKPKLIKEYHKLKR